MLSVEDVQKVVTVMNNIAKECFDGKKYYDPARNCCKTTTAGDCN